MTEADAKKKWCPFARTMQPGIIGERTNVVANRRPDGAFEASHCVGSACMAWRWNTSDAFGGHCGLAGRE